MFHFVVLEIASLTLRPWECPKPGSNGWWGYMENAEPVGAGTAWTMGRHVAVDETLEWIWGNLHLETSSGAKTHSENSEHSQ